MLRLIITAAFFFSLIPTACNVESAILGPTVLGSPKVGALSIVISGSRIAFARGKVQLGQSLAHWKETIGGKPRCTDERVAPVMCTWDEIGLEVGTDDGLKNVKFANIFLRVPLAATYPPPSRPDGSPAGVTTATPSPRSSFPGRLQLDGADISSKTSFKHVRSSIDPRRNVRCGYRDCSSPHGRFGDRAQIFFELDGRDENNSIARIGFSRTDE